MGILIIDGIIFGGGVALGHAARDFEFDIDDDAKTKINKFWKKLDDLFFGPDVPDKVDTYTDKTPEVIKKDSLSAK